MKSSGLGSNMKSFFSKRSNIVIVISIVSFLIIFLVAYFFWLIYTKDKPNFIPEETKGKIRKGIEEGIGENVKDAAPNLGQAIIDASFDNKNGGQESGADASSNPGDANSTEGWVEYKIPSLNLTFKIPSDWTKWESIDNNYAFSKKSDVNQLKELQKKAEDSDQMYWAGKSIGVVTIPKGAGLNNSEEYIAKTFPGPGITNEELTINGRKMNYIVDRGPNRFGGGVGYYYIFEKDNRLFEVSLDYTYNQTPSSEYLEILREMAESIQ